MRKNKIGSIFLISVLALAGIGISYAGFTDEITVFGTVETGTVSLELDGNYSGTWLFKIWDGVSTTALSGWEIKGQGTPTVDTVAIYRGGYTGTPDDFAVSLKTDLATFYNGQNELVSYAYARPGGDDEKDVVMVYDNIFPCTWYWADFIVHYNGTIPVHVTIENADWVDFDIVSLWEYNITAAKGVVPAGHSAYHWTKITGFPVQLHHCNKLSIDVGIHMLQPEDVNNYQGQTYTFSFDIVATQWYDPCPE